MQTTQVVTSSQRWDHHFLTVSLAANMQILFTDALTLHALWRVRIYIYVYVYMYIHVYAIRIRNQNQFVSRTQISHCAYMCADEFLAARRALRIIDFSAVYYLKTIISPNDTDPARQSQTLSFLFFSPLFFSFFSFYRISSKQSRESHTRKSEGVRVKKEKRKRKVQGCFLFFPPFPYISRVLHFCMPRVA